MAIDSDFEKKKLFPGHGGKPRPPMKPMTAKAKTNKKKSSGPKFVGA